MPPLEVWSDRFPVTLSIGRSDGRFQTRTSCSEIIKLAFYPLPLGFQLAATRFAQVFRMGAAYPRETALNIFRFDILV